MNENNQGEIKDLLEFLENKLKEKTDSKAHCNENLTSFNYANEDYRFDFLIQDMFFDHFFP